MSMASQGLALFHLLFNIYMKLLEEVTLQFRVWYHQDPDDTQLCASGLSNTSEAVLVTDPMSDSYLGWERVQFSTNKTEGLWLFGLLGLRMLHCWSWMELEFPIQNWGPSGFAAIAQRVGSGQEDLCTGSSCLPVVGWEALQTVIHALVTSLLNYRDNTCPTWCCL